MAAGAIAAGVGGLSSAAGSVASGKDAKKVARIQAQTADKNRQLYENLINQYTSDISPYTTSGTNALTAQQNLLGLNGAAGTGAQQQAFDNFNNSTGYQFNLNNGLNAINSNAYANGTADSGATLKALQDRGTQLANSQFNTYYNDLNGLSNQGLSAYQSLANEMNTATSGQASSNTAAANATSSGVLGTGTALNTGINNFTTSLSKLAGYLDNNQSGSSYGNNSNAFSGSGTSASNFSSGDF